MNEILRFTVWMFVILVINAAFIYILGKLEIRKIKEKTEAQKKLNSEMAKDLQLLIKKWKIEDQIFSIKEGGANEKDIT